jgi:DNA-binding MarR family transcriptional regulator
MIEVLASLERRGLISRTTTPDGGRAMPAELTRKGHASVLTVQRAMRGVEERLLSPFSRDDVTRLRRMLEGCLAAIDSAELPPQN